MSEEPVERRDGVQAGALVLRGTRITLLAILGWPRPPATSEFIASQYNVSAILARDAINWAHEHPDEVKRDVLSHVRFSLLDPNVQELAEYAWQFGISEDEFAEACAATAREAFREVRREALPR